MAAVNQSMDAGNIVGTSSMSEGKAVEQNLSPPRSFDPWTVPNGLRGVDPKEEELGEPSLSLYGGTSRPNFNPRKYDMGPNKESTTSLNNPISLNSEKQTSVVIAQTIAGFPRSPAQSVSMNQHQGRIRPYFDTPTSLNAPMSHGTWDNAENYYTPSSHIPYSEIQKTRIVSEWFESPNYSPPALSVPQQSHNFDKRMLNRTPPPRNSEVTASPPTVLVCSLNTTADD